MLRSHCSLIIVLICEIPMFTRTVIACQPIDQFLKANQIWKCVIGSFYIFLEFWKNIESIVHNRGFKTGAFIWMHCIFFIISFHFSLSVFVVLEYILFSWALNICKGSFQFSCVDISTFMTTYENVFENNTQKLTRFTYEKHMV